MKYFQWQGEKVDQNIPVYGSMYGDGTTVDHHHHPMQEDNLVLYCTLKKQQLYKPSISPALNAKQVKKILFPYGWTLKISTSFISVYSTIPDKCS